MNTCLLRFFRKPTVADYSNWCRAHDIKPPSLPVQEKLKQTSGFSDTKPWRVRFHQAVKKAGS